MQLDDHVTHAGAGASKHATRSDVPLSVPETGPPAGRASFTERMSEN
jgi:hypothetical protein